ncbi:hypothetical protein [Pantoea dispersa]|uniref:hypothetical protein n=1 Tax=Pantoea dispersa TaxID=59814 RepID=UPI001CA6E4C1|nr:hypothetical protein [Pantoea dispersa]QZY97640.1 hypothetical protein K7X52_23105 [Pantoea dispersa]
MPLQDTLPKRISLPVFATVSGRVLIRHYGGLVPDEIVLNQVMFLKVQDAPFFSGRVVSDGSCHFSV